MSEYVIRGNSLFEKVGWTNGGQSELLKHIGCYSEKELLNFIKQDGHIFYVDKKFGEFLCSLDNKLAEKIKIYRQ